MNGGAFLKFRSHIDRFFGMVITTSLATLGVVFFLPLFLDSETTLLDIIISIALFLACGGVMVWSSFFATYELHSDYLIVKGGVLKIRIPYEEITKVAPTRNVFTGYKVLASKDAIEIFYTSSLLGSVKISPAKPDLFLSELKARCNSSSFKF